MINQDDNHAVIHSTDNLYQTMMGDYVLKHDGKEPVALFNYKNDKLLTQNILSGNDSLKNKMERRLKAFIQQYNKHMIDNTLTVSDK